jgi:hypothetical protein
MFANGVRERPRRTPRNGEHQMQRNTERLCAMHVSKTRRIGNYGVGDEWHLCLRIDLDAGFPATLQHLEDHLTITTNLSRTDGCKFGYDARILHHVMMAFRILICFGIEEDIELTAINSEGSPPMG